MIIDYQAQFLTALTVARLQYARRESEQPSAAQIEAGVAKLLGQPKAAKSRTERPQRKVAAKPAHPAVLA